MRGCKLLSSVLPLLSLSLSVPPSPPPLLSSLHSWSWLFLYFDFLRALPQRIAFPRDMEKNLWHTQTYTWTNTHKHTPHNFLVARFASGPRTTQSKLSWKDCHDNAERMDRKGRGGGGTSVRTCAVSSVTFADSERERGWSFCEPTEEKIKVGEDAWCNTTKWLTFPLLVCQLGIGVVLMSTATPSAVCRRWQKEMCTYYRKTKLHQSAALSI